MWRQVVYYTAIGVWFLTCILAWAAGRQMGGINLLTISGGSMMPTVADGSLVMVAAKPEYYPGEIVSFWEKTAEGGKIVTHRIKRLGGNVYLTQGDANAAVDEPVRPRLVIGKVVVIVPYFGNIVEAIKSQIAIKAGLVGVAFLVIFSELGKIRRERNEQHQ